MKISIVAAVSENGVIGYKNKIPWHLPSDLKYFRRITLGHHIIMGRKTHEAIGHAFDGRVNIVITRNKSYKSSGCIIANSLDEALKAAAEAKEKEAMVIGGGQIYKQAMLLAERIYLTRVKANVNGDTYFPRIESKTWKEISCEQHPADEKNQYPYEFCILERR